MHRLYTIGLLIVSLISFVACGGSEIAQELGFQPAFTVGTLTDVDGYETTDGEIYVSGLSGCVVAPSIGGSINQAQLTMEEGESTIKLVQKEGVWNGYATNPDLITYKALQGELNCSEAFAFELAPIDQLSSSDGNFAIDAEIAELVSFSITSGKYQTSDPITGCHLTDDGQDVAGFEQGVQIIPKTDEIIGFNPNNGGLSGEFTVTPFEGNECPLVATVSPSLVSVGEGTVVIYVTDATNDTEIARAEVRLVVVGHMYAPAYTDNNGYAYFENVTSENDGAEVHVSANGYENSWQNVSLSQLVGKLPMAYSLQPVQQ